MSVSRHLSRFVAILILSHVSFTASAQNLPLHSILDFEGRTLVTPEAPSVPTGWHRLSLKDGFLDYPGHVRVQHLYDPGAYSGAAFLRMYLEGAKASLVTAAPEPLDRRFSYVLGGWHRWSLPPGGRVDPRKGASTLRLSLLLLDKNGIAVPGGTFHSDADLAPPGANWTIFPEISLPIVPPEANAFRVSLQLDAKDYHGYVDVDALYLKQRPLMSLVQEPPASGMRPGVRVDASGLPSGTALDLHFVVKDFRGDVVSETTSPALSLTEAAQPQGEVHLHLPLSSVGYGVFDVTAELVSPKGVVSSARTRVEHPAASPVPATDSVGLVLGEGAEPFDIAQTAFPARSLLIYETPLSIGHDPARLARLQQYLARPSAAKRCVWLRTDDTPPEAALRAAQAIVGALSRSVNLWLADRNLPTEVIDTVLGTPGIRREILYVGPAADAFMVDVQDIPQLPDTLDPRHLAILSWKFADTNPDILWALAELRRRGVGRVALRVEGEEKTRAAAYAAASYWAQRIMSAEYAGGSDMAAGVSTLLFTEKGQGLLLYRSDAGRKRFSAALGSPHGLSVIDLMGNRTPLAREAVPGVLENFDIGLDAEPFTRAVEGVNIGLLRTSMSVRIEEGARLLSAYTFQDLAVSLANHGDEAITVKVAPRGDRGWRFKPEITETPEVIPKDEKRTFFFKVRPSLLAVPGTNQVSVEVLPTSLGRGSFTVSKDVELYSPISVTVHPALTKTSQTQINVQAKLDKDYPGTPSVLTVGLRSGGRTARGLIEGLVPGGEARSVFPLVLPAPGASVEIWMNDTREGLFYNTRFAIAQPATF